MRGNPANTLYALILVTALVSLPSRAQQQPRESKLSATPPAVMAEQSAGKFALLIGIDKYKHVQQLRGCVNDVMALKKLLTSSKFSFDPANVATLIDGQASFENILEAFRSHLIANAKEFREENNKEATVVFFFSGHGSRVDDQNGDEVDRMDETIVTVGSRDKEGKNFDIRDDDIGALVSELAKYTSNVAYIFDSCYSGTINRGNLTSREVPEDTRLQPGGSVGERGGDGRMARGVSEDGLLPASDKYVMITGSRSFERSDEMMLKDGSYHGVLTFYLLRELKNAKPQTTYRGLMNRVALAVNHYNPNQTPQLLGDVTRPVLGGSARDEDYYIEVRKVEGNEITIAAGEAMGVKLGTLVAVYSPETARLAGEQGKLIESEVVRITPREAVITFTPRQGLTITPDAKAVLISPLFGGKPLSVVLEQRDGGGTTAVANRGGQILVAVSQQLRGSKLVKATLLRLARNAVAQISADAYVRSGKFAEVFNRERPELRKSADRKTSIPNPKDDDEVFYIAAIGGEPLFDFYVEMHDEKATEKIARALEMMAKHNNLKALENLGSPINPWIEVSVVKVTGNSTQEGFKIEKEEPLSLTQMQSEFNFTPGAYFKLRIKNNYDQDLYITALDISTDGAINVMYPRVESGQEALKHNESVYTNLFVTTRPYGQEVFKFVATRQFSDFRPLAQGGVRKSKRENFGPLNRLMEQALLGTRSKPVGTSFSGSDWGMAQLAFSIVPKGQ